jgi:4-amino-4-deoxy-L-arabinose transferase-like glycosyltransferase
MTRARALLTPENAALAFTAVTGFILAASVQLGPHGVRPIVDERAYVEWARLIARGQLLFPEPFYLDPLPAYLLGLLFKVSGGSLFFARLFYVTLGVGTVALLGRLARTLFSPREGRVAMWLLALYGPHTFALGWVLKEALAVHLTAWVLLLAALVQNESARPKRFAALGLAAGALMLSRGNYVPLMPLLGLWVLWLAFRRPGTVTQRATPALAFGLAFALPLAPVSLHNHLAGGAPIPVTVQGGANFWIGNNPQASGTYDHWDFSYAIPSREKSDYLAEAERRVGRKLTLRENSDYWFGLGLQFWREQPADALALLLKKSWLLIHNYEVPDTYSFSCFRAHFTPVLWVVPLGFGWLFGLALAGGALAVRRQPRARFAAAFFVLYGGSVAAFFVFDRYRIPLSLALCLFAGHALVDAWTRLREKRTQGLWLSGAAVFAVTVLAFVPTPISRQQPARDAYCVAQAGMQLWADGLTAEAEPLLEFGRAHGQAEYIEQMQARHAGAK